MVAGHSINWRIFRLQLEPHGLRVDDAAGAMDGLRLLDQAAAAQDPYAAAILDHVMPTALDRNRPRTTAPPPPLAPPSPSGRGVGGEGRDAP